MPTPVETIDIVEQSKTASSLIDSSSEDLKLGSCCNGNGHSHGGQQRQHLQIPGKSRKLGRSSGGYGGESSSSSDEASSSGNVTPSSGSGLNLVGADSNKKGNKKSTTATMPASDYLVLNPRPLMSSQRKLTPFPYTSSEPNEDKVSFTSPSPLTEKYSKIDEHKHDDDLPCNPSHLHKGNNKDHGHSHNHNDNHGHSHSHAIASTEDAVSVSHAKSNKTRLMLMFTLTFGFFLVEIVVGYMSNSMALVADSFHMLSDVAALVVAFMAVKMSPKKWSKNTFGWARAEVLGALVNAVFLVALCFSILIESVKRFIKPDGIHNPQLVLGVGIAGLVVNLIGIFLFHSHGGSGHSHAGHHTIKHQSRLTRMVATDDNENDERVTSPDNAPPPPEPPPPKIHGHSHGGGNMNMRGVFLHLLADALGSVIVIISALIIWQTNWEYVDYVDPALSVIMVVLILHSVWPLLQESSMILLQTVPTHIQIDELQRRLVDEVEGVIAVHEFHIWQLAGDRIIASAHIRCRNLHDYIQIAEKVKEFFHNEGIHSTTIQPEFVEHYPENGSTEDCFIACPLNETTAISCAANSCCGPTREKPPSDVVIDH